MGGRDERMGQGRLPQIRRTLRKEPGQSGYTVHLKREVSRYLRLTGMIDPNTTDRLSGHDQSLLPVARRVVSETRTE